MMGEYRWGDGTIRSVRAGEAGEVDGINLHTSSGHEVVEIADGDAEGTVGESAGAVVCTGATVAGDAPVHPAAITRAMQTVARRPYLKSMSY